MKRGFTLIEILISIAIIAILTAIGIVSYTSISKRSRDAKRMGDVEQIRSALEMYRSDNGKYPAVNVSGFGVVTNLNTDLIGGGYMPSIPSDPQTTYPYKIVATNNDITSGYYGYCFEAHLETIATGNTTSNCGAVMLDTGYNYGVRQP